MGRALDHRGAGAARREGRQDQKREDTERATAVKVRGGEDSVTALPALWADIDIAGPDHPSDTLSAISVISRRLRPRKGRGR